MKLKEKNMATELGRMLKCLTGGSGARSYAALQDDYARIGLIAQDGSGEGLVVDSSSLIEDEKEESCAGGGGVQVRNNNKRRSSSSSKKSRPRSAGDITDGILVAGGAARGNILILNSVAGGASAATDWNCCEATQAPQTASSGGFLNFLKKSSGGNTKHLERGAILVGGRKAKEAEDQGDKDRYTKFPVSPLSLLQQPSSQEYSGRDSTHVLLTPKSTSTRHRLIQSPNRFLAQASQAVSSLGRKERDKRLQLKTKSKSDNSLHRVSAKSPSISSTATNRGRLTDDDEDVDDGRLLNSVQLGDHATIRLPWTGFQPLTNQLNDLSSATRVRPVAPTHRNQFDIEQERYVELGGGKSGRLWNCSSGVRRRSRSLERAHNLRIFPAASAHIIKTAGEKYCSSTGKKIIESTSLERPGKNRIRNVLSKEEEEILRRNIASLNPILPPKTRRKWGEVVPPLPEKKKPLFSGGGLSNKVCTSLPVSSCSSNSSVEDEASCSAPPSPPPRPAASLKNKKNRSAGVGVVIKAKMETTSRPSATPGTSFERQQQQQPPFLSVGTAIGGTSFQHQMQQQQQQRLQQDESVTTSRGASGFINKPSKGWLHPDSQLVREGVQYTVRYIGCLDVNTSMKNLDYDTRSVIAKECINQVCEAAGMKSIDKKRKIDRRVVKILGLRPRLDQAGTDVHLTITSTCLKLTSLDGGVVIASHDLPNISFASGGDATMLDFVAYVAKDAIVGRACFVLECGSGRAQDVITTVGQAFELRFKEYLQKRPAGAAPATPAPVPIRVIPSAEEADRDYYNDLPGKLPPDEEKAAKSGRGKDGPNLTLPNDNKELLSVNLIDFEAPTPPAFGPTTNGKSLEALLMGTGTPPPVQSPTVFSGSSMIQDVGGSGSGGLAGGGAAGGGGGPPPTAKHDPFNMQPFDDVIPNVVSSGNPLNAEEQKKELEGESWFHGVISRAEAESLVKNDGDFLVRESQNTTGQYVLTGLQNGSCKHLLLVDPEGVVRTKDKEFDSVGHLIRYHSDNCLPIISSESMVLLQNSVPRSG